MANPDFDINVGLGGDKAEQTPAFRVVPFIRRRRPTSLIHTLVEGQEIVLGRPVGGREVKVHDPHGTIKVGNSNVRIRPR